MWHPSSRPGTEPAPATAEAHGHNHWASREVMKAPFNTQHLGYTYNSKNTN